MTEQNWCDNVVTLCGSPKHIEELIEFVRGDDREMDFGHEWNGQSANGDVFTFTKIIPIEGKWSSALGLAKWGCRSDAINVTGHCRSNYARYRFNTPACPPIPICNALRLLFPDIFCSWFFCEPQNLYAGFITSPQIYKEIL